MNNQSDSIAEPWPDIEANCFNVGSPCHIIVPLNQSGMYVSDLHYI